MKSFLGFNYGSAVTVEALRPENDSDSPVALRSTDRHQWAVRIPLRPTANPAVLAAHQSHHGTSVAFDLPMPQLVPKDEFDATSAPAVILTSAAAKGASSVKIGVATGTLDLPAGAFITITGDLKVYAVRAAVTLGTEGAAVSITPTLRKTSRGGAAVNLEPTIRARYSPTSVGVQVGGLGLAQPTLEAIEVAR